MTILGDRESPDQFHDDPPSMDGLYERTLAKMGALPPYRRAHSLLEEFLGRDAPEVETIRTRTMGVGARLERNAVAPTMSSPSSQAGSIALAIDGGHVKSVRSYQVRSFEVFVAQVSNDASKRGMFSSVPAEADRRQQQLRGVLQRLGATPRTPVTIPSDGADGPRSFGQAVSVGPTHHVLDCFHLSMRIQHVAPAAKGWPDATPGDRAQAACLADTIEHIRWRLWHGQVQRALDLIGDTLMILDAAAKTPSPHAATAGRGAGVLRRLETYVSGQSGLIKYRSCSLRPSRLPNAPPRKKSSRM